jgi:ribonuclease Z
LDLAQTGQHDAGQRIGYVTDIRDSSGNMATVSRICAGTDPLFIEASFPACEEERTRERGHLTTAAGRMARAANARRVEPFHSSPRNPLTEDEVSTEIGRAF